MSLNTQEFNYEQSKRINMKVNQGSMPGEPTVFGDPRIIDTTSWVATGEPVDMSGIKITGIRASHKRTWSVAICENPTYEMSAYAEVGEGQDPHVVAQHVAKFVRESVQAWAIPELELCERLKPHVMRAIAGVPRKETEMSGQHPPTGITPALHMAQAEMARQLKEKPELLNQPPAPKNPLQGAAAEVTKLW